MCVKVKKTVTKFVFIENQVFVNLGIDTEEKAMDYAKKQYPDALKYEFLKD